MKTHSTLESFDFAGTTNHRPQSFLQDCQHECPGTPGICTELVLKSRARAINVSTGLPSPMTQNPLQVLPSGEIESVHIHHAYPDTDDEIPFRVLFAAELCACQHEDKPRDLVETEVSDVEKIVNRGGSPMY